MALLFEEEGGDASLDSLFSSPLKNHLQRSVACLTKASALGSAQALTDLGWAYQYGQLNMEIDAKKAKEYYSQADLKNYSRACCNLALLCLNE